MKFISSREIRSNPARLWEVTGSDESVITVNGKPRAIVVPVGEDLEVTLASLRRARAFNAVLTIRMFAQKKGLVTQSDQIIEHEKRNVRTGR